MSITVTLSGGCSNQQFQFATGYALSKLTGRRLLLDTSQYDQPNEWRMYSLGLFPNLKFKEVKGPRGRIIYEQGMPYNPKLFERIDEDVTLHGYWQSFRYFQEFRDELQVLFMPQPIPPDSVSMLGAILACEERSVFVTVRRTDYVNNNYHGLLDMSYYQKAAELIASQVSSPVFFVFSDDIQWCKDYFRLGPHKTIIAGNFYRTVKPKLGREDSELWLMRNCRHAILANSSYSAWGCWLGFANRGFAVAPLAWFGPDSKEDAKDICCPHWRRI